MGAAAEKSGIPAVSIIAPEFASLCRTAVQGEGLPSLPFVFMDQGVMSGSIGDVRPSCEAIISDIVHALTQWKPEDTEKEEKKWLEFEGLDYQETADKMNTFFLRRRWSDGLPLTPPTEKRVEWMLTGTDLPPHRILVTKLFPRRAPITVENVAVHAVMAGARPEYLPIILAAVSLLNTETYDGQRAVHFLQESVGMFAPVLIVNGPIAGELKINSSYGVMGPGWRADATIGRALNLILSTAGGYSGPPEGTPRGQSLPGRYTCCFAENEAENPWQPLHVELGYPRDVSAVTLMLSSGTHTIMVHPPAEQVAGSVAWAIKGLTRKSYAMSYDQLLVLGPAHAHVLANAGWSKTAIKDYVYKKARLSVAQAEEIGLTVGWGEWRERLGANPSAMYASATVSDKSILVPMTEKPDDLVIVVAGGPGSDNSTLIPCIVRKLTEEIDKYKPSNWPELLKKADKELMD